MSNIGKAVEIAICSVVYAFVGLTIGVSSGYIVTKLIEWLSGASLVFSMTTQIMVAFWALLLAGLAVLTYLRAPQGGHRH